MAYSTRRRSSRTSGRAVRRGSRTGSARRRTTYSRGVGAKRSSARGSRSNTVRIVIEQPNAGSPARLPLTQRLIDNAKTADPKPGGKF